VDRRPRAAPHAALFLLSAHISAMAVSMLLYPNERIGPVVFATALAITSKVVFRVSVGGRDRHVFNPSNFGIAVVLIVLPWVGIAPPYQFTENVAGLWDWAIPAIIICSGTLINYRYTDRLCLLGSWASPVRPSCGTCSWTRRSSPHWRR
jgi:hypothetical protein